MKTVNCLETPNSNFLTLEDSLHPTFFLCPQYSHFWDLSLSAWVFSCFMTLTSLDPALQGFLVITSVLQLCFSHFWRQKRNFFHENAICQISTLRCSTYKKSFFSFYFLKKISNMALIVRIGTTSGHFTVQNLQCEES